MAHLLHSPPAMHCSRSLILLAVLATSCLERDRPQAPHHVDGGDAVIGMSQTGQGGAGGDANPGLGGMDGGAGAPVSTRGACPARPLSPTAGALGCSGVMAYVGFSSELVEPGEYRAEINLDEQRFDCQASITSRCALTVGFQCTPAIRDGAPVRVVDWDLGPPRTCAETSQVRGIIFGEGLLPSWPDERLPAHLQVTLSKDGRAIAQGSYPLVFRCGGGCLSSGRHELSVPADETAVDPRWTPAERATGLACVASRSAMVPVTDMQQLLVSLPRRWLLCGVQGLRRRPHAGIEFYPDGRFAFLEWTASGTGLRAMTGPENRGRLIAHEASFSIIFDDNQLLSPLFSSWWRSPLSVVFNDFGIYTAHYVAADALVPVPGSD
jgi:hypothetical protein